MSSDHLLHPELEQKNSLLLRTMFTIALPVMLQNAAEYLLVFTDLAFVGNYDGDGLSAINNVTTPFFAFLSFFFAVTQGVTIVISQQLGARKPLFARRVAETCLSVNAVLGLAYMVFWLTAGRTILQLMGAQAKILELGVTYLNFFALHLATLGFGATFSALFQAVGKTLPIMVVVIFKVLLNVLLSWFLVFGVGPFPEMGVAGSALATTISAVLGDLILAVLFFRLKPLRLSKRRILKPAWRLYGRVLKIGIPVGTEYILWSLGQAIIIGFVNRLDTSSSGQFGVFNILIGLSMTLYIGIGVSVLVLVGHATGAKRHSLAKKVADTGTIASMIACVIAGAIMIILPDQLLSIFIKDAAARAPLITLMTLAALIGFPKALNISVGNAIRATGNTLWMLYTQIGGTVGIIALAAFFIFGLGWTIAGLMWAVFFDELLRGVVNQAKWSQTSKLAAASTPLQ